jgi:hypothetical protein
MTTNLITKLSKSFALAPSICPHCGMSPDADPRRGATLLRVFGKDQRIVESVALVERQDHTVRNKIKEVVLVTVQDRSETAALSNL